MHASLLKARLCEQRSQYDAALKIDQGQLGLVPSHPQINGHKSELLIDMGRPGQSPYSRWRSLGLINPVTPSTGCDWWPLFTAVGV